MSISTDPQPYIEALRAVLARGVKARSTTEKLAIDVLKTMNQRCRTRFYEHFLIELSLEEIANKTGSSVFTVGFQCRLGLADFANALTVVAPMAEWILKEQKSYRLLKSRPEDSDEYILAQRNKLLKKFHPDRNFQADVKTQARAEEKTKALVAAFEWIKAAREPPPV